MNDSPGNWETSQKILVILAHPDDPEFFCGATLAKWARTGHNIHYLLLTCGDKGGGLEFTPAMLCAARHEEQQRAANIIGAKSVQFMDLEDGYLIPSLELRRAIVRHIRREKPDILVTCDPTNLFPNPGIGLNHPDHRAAGQVVLDAVFPAAGNVHYFPELLKDENLQPHTPSEVWVSIPTHPNVILDTTEFFETKLEALKQHRSQIGDVENFKTRMRSRHTEASDLNHPRYEEKFYVFKFRKP